MSVNIVGGRKFVSANLVGRKFVSANQVGRKFCVSQSSRQEVLCQPIK